VLRSGITRVEFAEAPESGADLTVKAVGTFVPASAISIRQENGAAHWHEHCESHTLRNWIADDGALLQGEISAAAVEAARQLGVHLRADASSAVASGSLQ
jgi:hypothetical protein